MGIFRGLTRRRFLQGATAGAAALAAGPIGGSRSARALDLPGLVPPGDPAPDAALAERQTGDRIKAAIDAVPPEQAELLRMAFWQDKPHTEIAEELGLPLGTVKSRIRLALMKLRRSLEEIE